MIVRIVRCGMLFMLIVIMGILSCLGGICRMCVREVMELDVGFLGIE